MATSTKATPSPFYRDNFNIHLRLGREQEDMPVDASTTGLKVKEFAATHFDIPINSIKHIVHAGEVLKDDQTVFEIFHGRRNQPMFFIFRQ